MGNKARILRITGINGIYNKMYNPFPLDSNAEIDIKNTTTVSSNPLKNVHTSTIFTPKDMHFA